ncbi:hypothetical protein [Nitrospirillum sp. BR 11828]|uniref:hypothetical protein n=1 Tax=Nitrospirillum sp. BR 11828 TaxID=3104325 RepID=UPI002ACAE55B|nr:hypothetical protein [Nitrospirillum sp. BR 11828]MDZ5649430.1 hypothetical protein [Nitrospirillum sp. BR 11828]
MKLKMLEWADGVARLSELGDLAIETGKVLVAEQGVWRFHLIDDPLVPNPVVHAERIKTEAAHKLLSKQKKGEEDFRGQLFSPALLIRDSINTAAHRSLADSKLRQIQDVGEKGQEREKGSLKLDLSWRKDGPPMVRLTGRLPESEHRIDAVAGSDMGGWTYAELWMELASAATTIPVEVLSGIQARLGLRAVPVPFEAVDINGRKTFRMDFPVPKTRVRGIGDFLPSSLSQADILPATDRDAQDWCEWLQWNEITDYVTPEMLRTQAAGVLAKFPHHRPSPLGPDAMRALALSNDNLSAVRHVLAPADLGLWR